MALQKVPINEIPENDWNQFCLSSSQAWFTHTTYWLEYTLNMRFSQSSINHSYGIYVNNKLIAIVPLIEEDIVDSKGREISMAGFPTPLPALHDEVSADFRKKILKEIFHDILKIEGINYWNFYVPPLIDDILYIKAPTNTLSKFQLIDTTISTNVLNLKPNIEIIFRKFRKGHKSDINYFLKTNHAVEIIDTHNFSLEKLIAFQEIHRSAAGRITRPDSTWECMAGWIKNGLSILAMSKNNGTYTSGALINIFKNRAYYQSSATLPEYQMKRGLNHHLQWEIMNYLKSINIQFYELGWIWNRVISQEVPDEKMLNISRFKSGFGADCYPLYRGELFSTKEYMLSVYNERVKQYWNYIH